MIYKLRVRKTSSVTYGQDGPLQDRDTVTAADVVRNLGCKALVVHQEKVNFPCVADQELLEAVGEKMAGLS